jgi:hypothetical protein
LALPLEADLWQLGTVRTFELVLQVEVLGVVYKAEDTRNAGIPGADYLAGNLSRKSRQRDASALTNCAGLPRDSEKLQLRGAAASGPGKPAGDVALPESGLVGAEQVPLSSKYRFSVNQSCRENSKWGIGSRSGRI